MMATPYRLRIPLSFALAFTLGAGHAADEPVRTPPPSTKAPAKKRAPVKPAVTLPAASTEQIEAAQNVYYGAYECEFRQSLNVAASQHYPAYVDVQFGKVVYLMKPVLSSTGAVRLEHTKGETLLVQIESKSMLLNVKSGQRMVDECIGAKQRNAIEVAKRFEDAGVTALIHTDIARDGMLAGPNLEASAELADAVTIPVIVSGGVSSEDDLVAAARLAPRGIAGAIVGRALYTGAVDLASALRRLASL